MSKILCFVLSFLFCSLALADEWPLDYYERFGLPHFSTKSKVKEAYRKIAKEIHPDLNRDLPTTEYEALEAKFKALSEAYKVLTEQKRKYDRFLKSRTNPPGDRGREFFEEMSRSRAEKKSAKLRNFLNLNPQVVMDRADLVTEFPRLMDFMPRGDSIDEETRKKIDAKKFELIEARLALENSEWGFYQLRHYINGSRFFFPIKILDQLVQSHMREVFLQPPRARSEIHRGYAVFLAEIFAGYSSKGIRRVLDQLDRSRPGTGALLLRWQAEAIGIFKPFNVIRMDRSLEGLLYGFSKYRWKLGYPKGLLRELQVKFIGDGMVGKLISDFNYENRHRSARSRCMYLY